MKFIETTNFWCPHVDRAACTNFSTRTVELRPSKHREILPFSSFLSISFFFPFLRTRFFPRTVFFLFLSFFFPFCFSLFSFSHLISHHFFSPSFLLIFSSFWKFLLHFGAYLTEWSREEASSPFPHAICVTLNFPSFFFYFFHCIIPHVANCEPHLQVHHMALAMCHSLWVPCGIPLTMSCVIRHPTPQKMCNFDCLIIQ